MSNTALSHGAPSLSHDGAAHGLSTLFSWPIRVARWIAVEYHMNRSVAELNNLDERVLRDIGIDRSQIASVVRHGRGR